MRKLIQPRAAQGADHIFRKASLYRKITLCVESVIHVLRAIIKIPEISCLNLQQKIHTVSTGNSISAQKEWTRLIIWYDKRYMTTTADVESGWDVFKHVSLSMDIVLDSDTW